MSWMPGSYPVDAVFIGSKWSGDHNGSKRYSTAWLYVTLAVGAGTVSAGLTVRVAGSDTQVGSLMNLIVRL